MIHNLIQISICFIFLSCAHPEGEKYERNHTKKIDFSASSNQIVVAADVPTIESRKHNLLKMEVQDGVRYVWIEINGIRLRFIFDTGASSICISPAEATVLYRQGTLQKEDILNTAYFQDATGKISEGTQVNLREVRVGEMLLENVQALVVDNVNAPLLLGQTVLERFGSIEIDNVNQEIIFK